jgi:hypothetical protein
LISIDELAAIAAPTAKPVIPDRAGDKRLREEAKLDVLDEELLEAKRHLSERLAHRSLRVPEGGKATAEARQITATDASEPDEKSLPYVKADLPVTRSIVEKESSYQTNKIVRQNYMLNKGGREFTHLISLVRSAMGGGGPGPGGGAGSKPASRNPPANIASQPTRYQMDQETAFRAAGIDTVIYQLDRQPGLLSAVHTDPATAPGAVPGPTGHGSERTDSRGSSDRVGKPSHPIIIVPQARGGSKERVYALASNGAKYALASNEFWRDGGGAGKMDKRRGKAMGFQL